MLTSGSINDFISKDCTMNNQNINFINNPIGYLNNNAVNHRWFDEHVQRANNGNAPIAEIAAVNLLPNAKQGNFDLQSVVAPLGGRPQVKFAVINDIPAMDTPLTAYWCPYVNGNGIPGFVDVPRRNPAYKFIFTAAMNGCAFIITDSPLGGGHFRVYHHQHPGTAVIDNLILAATPNIITTFGFSQYGNGALLGANLPVAFNFLYYRNGGWVIVSHATSMDALTGQVRIDPAKPLLVVDTNV